MADKEARNQFLRDPLGFLDGQLAAGQSVIAIGRNEYILGDPIEARSVLLNADGRYREHSDFFHTRHGLLEPQETRHTIRRNARALLRDHLKSQNRSDLANFISTTLPTVSQWPDTGNRLTFRYLKPFLASTDSPPGLYILLDEIVERSVLANARTRQPRWRRMLLQFRTTLLLSRILESRRAAPPRDPPLDVLDVIVSAADREHGEDILSEVFLSFLFAVAGSVGFVLAWSIYLLGTNPHRNVPARWVVQEALRLWPVAWQLGRAPARPHQVAGVAVDGTDEMIVCPYSVHRHPEYWSEPDAFRPERWSDEREWRNPAFIPFGHGPHRCVAADLASQFVIDFLETVTERFALGVVPLDCRPTIAAAMAPPPFTLTLTQGRS